MIHMKANTRRAVALSDDLITTSSSGIEVNIRCSEAWDGLTRIAIFRGSDTSVDVLLSGDSCTVPAEVLTQSGGQLLIGLYGTDGTGSLVIPTVWADAGRILPGAVPSGIQPTPEEQTLLDQLIEALQRDAAAAAASAAAAQSSADNADSSADDAAAQAILSESWAVGNTGQRTGENTNNSKFWAQVAQQGAEHSGYAIFDVNDQDGQMYVTITDPLSQDVSFLVNENTGELEVTIHG